MAPFKKASHFAIENAEMSDVTHITKDVQSTFSSDGDQVIVIEHANITYISWDYWVLNMVGSTLRAILSSFWTRSYSEKPLAESACSAAQNTSRCNDAKKDGNISAPKPRIGVVTFPHCHTKEALCSNALKILETAPVDCETYIKSMIPLRNGYPLWYPQPNFNLPIEYRRSGVSIGDVGIITPDGGFDFLFNVLLPSKHPINISAGLPPDFNEAIRPKLITRPRISHTGARTISSLKNIKTDFNESTNRISFICTDGDAGAILSVPDGASEDDLSNEWHWKQFISQNALSWYRYARENCGRDLDRHSLYFVTGHTKSNSWGISTYNTPVPERNEVLVMEKSTDAFSPPFVWKKVEGASVYKSGPIPELLSEVDGKYNNNQCLFLRGFKISLSEKTWEELWWNDNEFDYEIESQCKNPYSTLSGWSISPPSTATPDYYRNCTQDRYFPASADEWGQYSEVPAGECESTSRNYLMELSGESRINEENGPAILMTSTQVTHVGQMEGDAPTANDKSPEAAFSDADGLSAMTPVEYQNGTSANTTFTPEEVPLNWPFDLTCPEPDNLQDSNLTIEESSRTDPFANTEPINYDHESEVPAGECGSESRNNVMELSGESRTNEENPYSTLSGWSISPSPTATPDYYRNGTFDWIFPASADEWDQYSEVPAGECGSESRNNVMELSGESRTNEEVSVFDIPRRDTAFHPSNAINDKLLSLVPFARMAITHDNVWLEVAHLTDINNIDMLGAIVGSQFVACSYKETAMCTLEPVRDILSPENTGPSSSVDVERNEALMSVLVNRLRRDLGADHVLNQASYVDWEGIKREIFREDEDPLRVTNPDDIIKRLFAEQNDCFPADLICKVDRIIQTYVSISNVSIPKFYG